MGATGLRVEKLRRNLPVSSPALHRVSAARCPPPAQQGWVGARRLARCEATVTQPADAAPSILSWRYPTCPARSVGHGAGAHCHILHRPIASAGRLRWATHCACRLVALTPLCLVSERGSWHACSLLLSLPSFRSTRSHPGLKGPETRGCKSAEFAMLSTEQGYLRRPDGR